MSTVDLEKSKLICNGTQSAIMQAVRDRSPISRSGVASLTGLALQAVSRTVGPMLEEELLIEIPLADTAGPRRKRALGLNPDIGYCLSISYGPDCIEGCAVDTAYNVIMRDRHEINLGPMPKEKKLRAISVFTERFLSKIAEIQTVKSDKSSEKKADSGKCLAIALVDPGTIDVDAGTSLKCTLMDDWENVPLVERFQEKFKIPVSLTCDSLACISAVDRLELSGAISNLVYIQYGQGIGSSLKLGGHYITGQSYLAGEFGHSRATDQPLPCRCGSTGCLEAVAALPALAKNATAAIAEGSESALAEKISTLTGLDVLVAADEGDRLANRIVHEAYECLAKSIGGLINTLAPEMVLFENTVGLAGEAEVSAFFQAIRRNVLPSHSRKLELQVSKINSHVACLGGAVAALDYCME